MEYPVHSEPAAHCKHSGGRSSDEIPCPAIAGEQGLHFSLQSPVACADVFHERAAFILCMLQRLEEHCLEALPSLRIHRVGLLPPSWRADGALDVLEWWHRGQTYG
jgi:hypothetical protein